MSSRETTTKVSNPLRRLIQPIVLILLALVMVLPARANKPRIARHHARHHARHPRAVHAARVTRVQGAGTHPRLLVTQADVATMRTWATAGNPWWTDIANVLVPQIRTLIANGTIPNTDNGSGGHPNVASEQYAVILAFASLMEPDPVVAADDAQKAHDLVMFGFNQAKLGDLTTNPQTPFRDPGFMTSDRMRWTGYDFPLTVDWCYQTFTAQERQDIAGVFARWCNDERSQGNADASYPTPIGTLANPILYNSASKRRWSANNYYQGRTLLTGLMANALDPADDPGNILIGPYNDIFWKAWMYVRDHSEDSDYPGGISPEGTEYGINGYGFVAMAVEVLNHAGLADPAKYGSVVNLLQKSHWQNYAAACVHQLSPNKAIRIPNSLGPVYYPAEYGDTRTYQTVEPVLALFAIGRYNAEHGLGTGALDAVRWICNNMRDFAPSQWRKLQRDTFSAGNPIYVIEHFMMFDPTSASQYGSADPRPNYPLDYVSPGLTRILSRTDWTDNATWVIMHAPWNQINHQVCQCGKVELYRKGEWLTCARAGYGSYHDASDNGNSLSLQSPYRSNLSFAYTPYGQHGSQYLQVEDGLPGPTNVYSLTPSYIYLQTEMTGLYRSTYAASLDVTQANRSVMWLRGDHILVYDRAKSAATNEFKREEWSTVTMPTVSGNVATATNASGQKLFITSVLPVGATLTPYNPKDPAFLPAGDTGGLAGEQEDGTPMHYRVRIEDATNPQTVRWLTVLQGADSGTAATTPGQFASTSGTAFDGVTIGDTAALFIRDPSVAFTGTTFAYPAGAAVCYLTGLAPSSGYTVTNSNGAVSVAAGGSLMTDSGGVLGIPPPPPPPATPIGLVGTAGDTQVSLTWNAVPGATGYNLKRSNTSGGPYTTIASPPGVSYVDQGLTNGTACYYVVSATNVSGESGNSAEVNATPLPPIPPAPANLAAASGDTQVVLNWNASAGAAGYNVYRGTTAGGPYSPVAQNVSGVSYTDPGLTNGTPYFYRVSAVNLGGESGLSNEASVTPAAPFPPGMTVALAALTPIKGGTNATITVMLSSPAPAGGLTVGLSSSNPALIAVPASVTVPAGTKYATVRPPTGAVTQNTVVTVTGTLGTQSTGTKQITLTP